MEPEGEWPDDWREIVRAARLKESDVAWYEQLGRRGFADHHRPWWPPEYYWWSDLHGPLWRPRDRNPGGTTLPVQGMLRLRWPVFLAQHASILLLACGLLTYVVRRERRRKAAA